jgi:hypothetical protein
MSHNVEIALNIVQRASNPRSVNHDNRAVPKLCDNCQNFDIQSFTRNPNHTRGFLHRDVKHGAEEGCEFCSLLWDSIEGVELPTYKYANFRGGQNPLLSDDYVHMTISKDYDNVKLRKGEGLGANRMLVERGHRFTDVRNASDWEICLAAEPGKYSLCLNSHFNLTQS